MTPSARRGGSLARVEVPSRTELYVDRRFLPLADRFFAMYRQPQQGGGALVVYLGGEKVLDIWPAMPIVIGAGTTTRCRCRSRPAKASPAPSFTDSPNVG